MTKHFFHTLVGLPHVASFGLKIIIKIFKNVDIRASELNFFIFVPDEDPEIDVKSKKKGFVP